MSSKTPTRIELHRLKYHASGKKAKRIPFDRLDPEEKRIVARDVLTHLHVCGPTDPYRAYAEVMESWGVACPHPQHMRRYSGGRTSPYHLVRERWYSCEMCHCSVINEDLEPRRRTG